MRINDVRPNARVVYVPNPGYVPMLKDGFLAKQPPDRALVGAPMRCTGKIKEWGPEYSMVEVRALIEGNGESSCFWMELGVLSMVN